MANKEKSFTHSITLGNREIPLVRQMIQVNDLLFYPENPRVHSIIWANDIEPDQETIESAFKRFDHVKQLIQSIRANGGVTDPLLVRQTDMVVLEGNSRLAACRILMKEDPIKWGIVKCDLMSNDINDDDVFALLIQYHIVGKKDWDPFEQAGLFWRRYNDGESSAIIAEDVKHLGVSSKRIAHMVKVYSFMVKQKDLNPYRWSYYDEYLKSRRIEKARAEYEQLDSIVVNQIKKGKIKRAVDVRQKLDEVCRVGGRTLKSYVTGKVSLSVAHDRAETRGAGTKVLSKIQTFREFISAPEARTAVNRLDRPGKCKSELKRIKSAIERLIQDIEKNN